jgi:hypothetical protein
MEKSFWAWQAPCAGPTRTFRELGEDRHYNTRNRQAAYWLGLIDVDLFNAKPNHAKFQKSGDRWEFPVISARHNLRSELSDRMSPVVGC